MPSAGFRAVFHALLAVVATAAAPAQDPVLAPGAAVTGALDAGAPEWSSPKLRAAAGRRAVLRGAFLRLGDLGPGPWTIEASSFDFDAWVAVLDDEDRPLAEADGGGAGTDARLVVEAEAARGTAVVVAAKDGRVGEFRIEVRAGRPGPADPKSEARALLDWVRAATARLDAQAAEADPDAADRMLLLGRRLGGAGLGAEAPSILDRAVARQTAARGKDHASVAVALDDLGNALEDGGRFPEARDAYRRSRDVLAASGARSESMPLVLQHLSRAERMCGDPGAAAKANDEAFRLLEADDNAPVVLRMQLAVERSSIQEDLGNQEEALRWNREASRLAEGRPGEVRMLGAQVRVREGFLLRRSGRLAEARAVFHEARAVLAERPDGDAKRLEVAREAAIVAALLDDAAGFDADAAEARRHLANLPGGGPKDRADLLHQLGRAELSLGRLERAAELLREASAAWRECAHPSVRDVSLTEVALGEVLCRSGKEEEGIAILDAERARFEARQGDPDLDVVLGSLAQVQLAAGRPAEARTNVERLISIEEASAWTSEALHVNRRFFLAACCAAMGDAAAARDACRAALARGRASLDRELAALSERDRLGFLAGKRYGLDTLIGLGRLNPKVVPADEVYAEVLEWKGAVARGILAGRAWLRRSMPDGVVALQEKLHGLSREIESADRGAAAGRAPRNPERVAALVRERSEIEQRLLGSAGGRTDAARAGLPDIAVALADGTVLVDFVVHRALLVPESEARRADRVRGDRVVAFVLRRGAAPLRVELGPLAPIAEATEAHLRLVARRRVPAGAVGTQVADAAAERLAALVWKPLGEAVAAARRVIVCPDGALALLPFETLPGRLPGTCLIEDHEFAYVQSAGDVLAREVDPGEGRRILLVGDPGFEELPAGTRASIVDGALPRLPGTRAEVEAIVARAREAGTGAEAVDVVTGEGATESAVKRLAPGRSLIHVATHGWFAPAAEGGVDRTVSFVLPGNEGPPPLAPPEILAGLRSGLVLAAEPAPSAGNDGLLTAEEIGWLDLSACDLVVLSACESGVGRPFAGEHLLGLRRSLRLAGARASVTTLWKVPDDAALALMREFYDRLWLRKLPAPAALREARLALLSANRARPGGDPCPGTWGAFIYDGPAR